jgi:hypothetical protein
LRHLDIRSASDINSLPPADWVIDAAANPSVLAGLMAARAAGKGLSTTFLEQSIFLNTAKNIELALFC